MIFFVQLISDADYCCCSDHKTLTCHQHMWLSFCCCMKVFHPIRGSLCCVTMAAGGHSVITIHHCNVASLTFCHQDKTKKEKEPKRGSQRNSRYVFSWQRHWWRQLWNRNTHTEWLCTCEVKPSHEHRKVLLDPTSEWGETLAFTSFALCLISFTPICEQQIAFSF